MTAEMIAHALDVDLLARELGNWRTSSRSGPAYQGLADGIRMLIVDGRLPVGARLPSERALADALRVSRTTVTAAYTQLRDDGYLYLLQEEPPEELRQKVTDAEELCPTGAITVEG